MFFLDNLYSDDLGFFCIYDDSNEAVKIACSIVVGAGLIGSGS